MHDIICPHCGGRFLARDVAFDLSKYVTELLFDDPRDLEDVQNAGFRYYADEESILSHTLANNHTPLFCENRLGPDGSDSWYPYVITCEVLMEYIKAQIDNADTSLETLLDEILEIFENKHMSYNIQHVNTIKIIYHMFFTGSLDDAEFSMKDHNVQVALRILLHIYTNPQKSLTLRVRLFSSKHNKSKPQYVVPDTMFVFENGVSQRLDKVCRYCGAPMATEFGYYKMVPVVLLGSHFSGKTSFLLAMLYSIRYRAPFASTNTKLRFATLDNDKDLIAFNNNIERYQRGESTLKTDFTNIPILNIRVNDSIYTFVDWPGEKFISANEEHDTDFVFRKRRVISQARHFLCFLEPSQVDTSISDTDENVRFPLMDLVEKFRWHMEIPGIEKIRSVSCIMNKFDMLLQTKHNTNEISGVVAQVSESNVYSDATWNNDNFERLNNAAQRYLDAQSPILYKAFEGMVDFEKIPKYYYPVSPYGKNPEEANGNITIHHTCLAGMPLLGILKTDKLIK